jgi:cystathionine beta-synthase
MVDAAEAEGLLQPGGTIVEPTSGNTGIGLAIVAALRGYRCVLVCTDKVAPEKIALMKAHGAEVHVCAVDVAPEDPNSYYSTAARLTAEIPGAWSPNQYANPQNPAAHEAGTGPEIFDATAGQVTHVVIGAGTGGTLTGVSRSLKRLNPNIVMVCVDAAGSVYSGGDGRPYLVEGIGEDFWPDTFDRDAADTVIAVSDARAFSVAREFTKTNGLLLGGSGGAAVAAGIDVADTAPAGSVVVVVIPDSGRAYLSRHYDDGWMTDNGFTVPSTKCGPLLDVASLLRDDESAVTLISVTEETKLNDVITIMRELRLSQIPVLSGPAPAAPAELRGVIRESDVLDAFMNSTRYMRPDDHRPGSDLTASDVMSAPLRTISAAAPLEDLRKLFETDPAVMVIRDGRIVSLLTREDLWGKFEGLLS